jgi:hypothetical protein
MSNSYPCARTYTASLRKSLGYLVDFRSPSCDAWQLEGTQSLRGVPASPNGLAMTRRSHIGITIDPRFRTCRGTSLEVSPYH